MHNSDALVAAACQLTAQPHGAVQNDGDSIIDTIMATWDYAGSFSDGTVVFTDQVGDVTFYAIIDGGGDLTVTNVDPFTQYTP